MDQIKEGIWLEVQEELRPDTLWLVKVVENVGGRLLLRPDGLDTGVLDFWMFYLDDRLHPLGWRKKMGYRFGVPEGIVF